MPQIDATVGRKVWYWPNGQDPHVAYRPDLPLDVSICFPHSNVLVNVAGFDANGVPFARLNMRLVQPGETPNPGSPFVTWMDWQIEQALAKEAADRQAMEVPVLTEVVPPPPSEPVAPPPGTVIPPPSEAVDPALGTDVPSITTRMLATPPVPETAPPLL
jgi:hypothetical protein